MRKRPTSSPSQSVLSPTTSATRSATQSLPTVLCPSSSPSWLRNTAPVVNYAEGKHQHVQTEFAFDIDEIAHHRVAPLRFLRRIGLKVPTKQLALAYYQTYGLSEDFSARRGRRFNVRELPFCGAHIHSPHCVCRHPASPQP